MIDRMLSTRIDGLAIVQREPRLWRYHVEGADVGPHFVTRGEAVEYVDRFAGEYGLIDPVTQTSFGEAIVRAIETLDRCHLDAAVIRNVVADLRAVVNR